MLFVRLLFGPSDSLEQRSFASLIALRKLRIAPGDRILEIGQDGALRDSARKLRMQRDDHHHQLRQFEYARDWAARAGLQDRIMC